MNEKASLSGDVWALLFVGLLAQAGGAGAAAVGWPRDHIADGCDPTAVDPLTGRLESCDIDQTGDWLTAVFGLVLSAAGSMMVLVALIAIGVHLGLSSRARLDSAAPQPLQPPRGAAPSAPSAPVVAAPAPEPEPAEPRQRRSDFQLMILIALGIVLAIALFAVTIGVLSG